MPPEPMVTTSPAVGLPAIVSGFEPPPKARVSSISETFGAVSAVLPGAKPPLARSTVRGWLALSPATLIASVFVTVAVPQLTALAWMAPAAVRDSVTPLAGVAETDTVAVALSKVQVTAAWAGEAPRGAAGGGGGGASS